MNFFEPPQHPGRYVRETALRPKKMSVTAAAKLIGVSRPGVSNFLNGKVGATPEMAARIDRAFGIPAQTLLDLQAAFDANQAKLQGIPSNTKVYVPPFLRLKAIDIEQWASQGMAPRARLSVLLRTLVHSTGGQLQKVDFPGNDDAERRGWDGQIEASQGTPWIPAGRSGWEFGVNQDVKSKADADFEKSVKAVSRSERESITFVFVTPRRWSGKANWIAKMAAKEQWKEVRAYDAQDLEQWLEQSLAGQAWFANEADRACEGIRSLDQCWRDWSTAATPHLVESFFKSSIEAPTRLLLNRLSGPPSNPIVIAADSVEEALAFLSVLFGQTHQLRDYRDRILVFGLSGVLPRLAQGAQSFIPVAFSREVERELAPFASTLHSIIVYPRNAPGISPDIVLEPAKEEDFRAALEQMGLDRDQIARCRDESGRSLTVLRRRLSRIPAVRSPAWASENDKAVVNNLTSMMLVGAWNFTNKTDQAGLSLLAGGVPYETLDKECQLLAQFNDAPVWSVGSYRGVVSKIDLLFAIAGLMTPSDLIRYCEVAELVLGEDNPALDLPEDKRWAAHIYGKQREFSAAFRAGISETLVLLAVYGDGLFRARFGMSIASMVSRVVEQLLPSPLVARKLEANDHDLPTYAEAAPDTFLRIVERDLKSNDPQVLNLLRPAGAGALWGHPSRTGLLWALEGLAWNPETFPRSTLILAELSKVEISDNWVNRPINSLYSVFRAWMPQTAANHNQRLNAIKMLVQKFPEVAWKICIKQFDTHGDTGTYSHKPRWRTDGYGYGEPFPTRGPVLAFLTALLELIFNWREYSRQQVCDLIERLQSFDDQTQVRVWELVERWATRQASDADKAMLREKIRVTVLSRRGRLGSKKERYAHLKAAAQAAYAALMPQDLLNKHEWLFREGWVEESMDDIHSDMIDFQEHEQRVASNRADALREILQERGFEGIFDLAHRGRAAHQIGAILTKSLLNDAKLHDLLCSASKRITESQLWADKSLVAGCLYSLDNQNRRATLIALKAVVSGPSYIRLLLATPFRSETWSLVDDLSPIDQNSYWSEVEPNWIFEDEEENSEAVKRLLAAQRPRAAFSCLRLSSEKVEPALLFRTLTEMGRGGRDEPGQYQLDYYSLAKVFKRIDQSAEFTMEQKAGLEFAYLEILDRSWSGDKGYGIPNLEKYIERYPEQYVQAIVWSYRRSSGGEDPPDVRPPAERITEFAERGHKLVGAVRRIPGRGEFGHLKFDLLSKWVDTVRSSLQRLDREKIGDIVLGQLLANAPAGDDGIWPCEPVRQLMEEVQSEEISKGARTGKYNLRGVHFRGEGGSDERRLASMYRGWADALQYSHPFVASSLLMRLVETYELEAGMHDDDADIRQRLR